MFVVGLLLLVIAAALWVFRDIARFRDGPDNRWPLFAKALLSEREQEFYRCLETTYPDHRVFVQVALSQLLAVKPDTPNWQSIRNQFSQLVADFVLCRRDLTVVAVIELDDSSHHALDRQDADRRKTRAVESAGLRLFRIPAGPIPSGAELQQILQVGSTLAAPTMVTTGTAPTAISVGMSVVSRAVLSLALVGLVVIGGWMVFSQVVSTLPKVMNVPPSTATPVPALNLSCRLQLP